VRVVLDTSVLFAAFRLESGFCTDLFRECVLRYELATSEYILEELQRHLIGKAKIAPVKAAEVIESLRSFAMVVVPTPLQSDV
jgi:predicted nucleic acid-binding protein